MGCASPPEVIKFSRNLKSAAKPHFISRRRPYFTITKLQKTGDRQWKKKNYLTNLPFARKLTF